MSSFGTGLLAAFGGMTEGAGKVMGEQARDRRKETVEAAKAKALADREENLVRLQSSLSQQRQDNQNAFTAGQQDKQNLFTSEQRDKQNIFDASQQDKQNAFASGQTQLNADLNLRNAKALAGYNASLKTTEPTDIEQKYNFLAKTFGKEKAEALISSSLVKKSGETELDYRKLWGKVYGDKLDALSNDMSDTRPLKEKEADAIATANQVTGITLGGSQNSQTVLGMYRSKVDNANGGTQQLLQPKASASGDTQSNKNTGILSSWQNTPTSENRKLQNSTGFKSAMDSVAENSGMNASPDIQSVIRMTQGQYNPSDGSVQFTPKNNDDLKKTILKIHQSGIKFGAKQGSNGEIILNVLDNKSYVK